MTPSGAVAGDPQPVPAALAASHRRARRHHDHRGERHQRAAFHRGRTARPLSARPASCSSPRIVFPACISCCQAWRSGAASNCAPCRCGPVKPGCGTRISRGLGPGSRRRAADLGNVHGLASQRHWRTGSARPRVGLAGGRGHHAGCRHPAASTWRACPRISSSRPRSSGCAACPAPASCRFATDCWRNAARNCAAGSARKTSFPGRWINSPTRVTRGVSIMARHPSWPAPPVCPRSTGMPSRMPLRCWLTIAA